MRELLRKQGYEISHEDAGELVATFDTNGDGRLQYFEALSL